ncbi:MAG: hypothetical protein P8179_13265 [Candidatus Thiodiazotropha sp.]
MKIITGFVGQFVHHIVPFLMLVVIAVVMLGANPFAGETIAPFDHLTRIPGWKNTGIVSPVKHHKHTDVLDFKLPAWRQARLQIRQGKIPVWNPLVLGGEPLLLLNTRSILTPAFAVYALIDDEGVGLYASALVNLLIISFGSYLLFLSLNANRLIALLGAVVFSYSGFNLSWFLWHHVNTSIWIPWVLFFSVRLLQTGDIKHLPRLALASALMILGGFPTVAVYGYIALVLLVISWSLYSSSALRLVIERGGWVFLGIVLSVIMTFVVLYCLDESLGRLDLSYRKGGCAFRSIGELLLFILPFSDGPLTLGRTGYVGILPLLLFFPAIWLVWRRRADWRYAWGLSLIFVIAPVAFAWIPMEYIRQIPLIGTSMISRLILIIGLGFAVLTTLVLSTLFERYGRSHAGWGSFILLLLLSFQVFDQRQVFQQLVGFVKTEAIYPVTSTIDYARKHVKPLQSVVSDIGFLLPGALSAYGLSEWFAHGFHTKQEKQQLGEIVDNPFLTPTAAGFYCDQVKFPESEKLAYFGIRYVLCSVAPKRGPKSAPHRVFRFVERSSDRGIDLMQHKVVQIVDFVGNIYFNQLRISLASVTKMDTPKVKLKLLKKSSRVAESDMCRIQIDSSEQYLVCDFPEEVSLEGGRYRLEIINQSESKEAALMVAMFDSESPTIRVEIDGTPSEQMLGLSGYDLNYLVAYQKVLDGDYKSYVVRQLEPGITLIENRRVTGSAYYLATLSGQPEADFNPVQLSMYSETSMQFEYSGEKPGWVIIPVRSYPGWSCTFNGEEVDLALFKGVLPAVPVTGNGVIEFHYRLAHSIWPILVSMVGIVLCLVLIFKANGINKWLLIHRE